MLTQLYRFLKSETGAITVDWVVLTAVIVGLAGASAGLVNSGIVSASSHISDGIEEQPIGALN